MTSYKYTYLLLVAIHTSFSKPILGGSNAILHVFDNGNVLFYDRNHNMVLWSKGTVEKHMDPAKFHEAYSNYLSGCPDLKRLEYFEGQQQIDKALIQNKNPDGVGELQLQEAMERQPEMRRQPTNDAVQNSRLNGGTLQNTRQQISRPTNRVSLQISGQPNARSTSGRLLPNVPMQNSGQPNRDRPTHNLVSETKDDLIQNSKTQTKTELVLKPSDNSEGNPIKIGLLDSQGQTQTNLLQSKKISSQIQDHSIANRVEHSGKQNAVGVFKNVEQEAKQSPLQSGSQSRLEEQSDLQAKVQGTSNEDKIGQKEKNSPLTISDPEPSSFQGKKPLTNDDGLVQSTRKKAEGQLLTTEKPCQVQPTKGLLPTLRQRNQVVKPEPKSGSESIKKDVLPISRKQLNKVKKPLTLKISSQKNEQVVKGEQTDSQLSNNTLTN